MSNQHDFYLARAAEARAEADAALLLNVRERCLRSAEAWAGMAARAGRAEAARAKTAADKDALTAHEAPELRPAMPQLGAAPRA